MCAFYKSPIFDGRVEWPIIREYIVGSRGASQLVGSLLGSPPGYKANKL